MKHIQFKLGPLRIQLSWGKPRINTIHAHEEGHRIGVGRVDHTGAPGETIFYSSLDAKPKL